MDMDLKPPTPQGPPPQAPLVTPTPPITEDPFKPDAPTAPTSKPVKTKKSRKGLKVFLLIVVALALMGAGGYGIFYWQHQHVDRLIAQRSELEQQIADQQAHMAEMEAENAKLTKEVPTTPTTDELVITAVTDYCQAGVNPANSKEALVYLPSPAGNKKVLYTADKQFAQLTAACVTKSTTSLDGSTQYFVKHSGSSWVVVARGALGDAALIKLYNLPAATAYK
jgi:cell division protein FtsL